MTAIDAADVHKRYGWLPKRRRPVLTGLDLTVPRSSIFGLIGPNGAGKTTFIKTLLGIVRPTAGRVTVLGGCPDEPRVRARIGYLPERLHFSPAVSARAYLQGLVRLRGLERRRVNVDALLAQVGLHADAKRQAHTFSKGMKQRLGLAAALLGEPELLVLDEPTDGLDPLGRAAMREIILAEHRRGATVLMNSHLLAETERICHRVAILVGGRIVREGSIAALCEKQQRWRVHFAAAPGDPASLGFLSAGNDCFSFAGDLTAVNHAVTQAVRAGAVLFGFGPEERDLEDILAEAVAEVQG